MEKLMKPAKPQSLRIDADAVIALIDWKATFAEAVVENAQHCAAKSKSSHSVTLTDFRHAARQALLKLAAAIESGDDVDGRQKAA